MITTDDDSLKEEKLQRISPLPGFITYEAKGHNLYGRYFSSTFVKDGKVGHTGEFLGRVIDKELGLFKNRARGFFTFSLENGYGEPDPQTTPLVYELSQNLTLHFGDIWLVDQTLKKTGLDKVLNNLIPNGSQTLKALVSFRLLDSHPDSFAEEWYRKSYARALYPEANLEPDLISSFHAILGQEDIFTKFFNSYLNLITNNKKIIEQASSPTLIDNSDPPNDIKKYLINVKNYEDTLTPGIRLIYIVDKITKLPIFYHIVPCYFMDDSTLKSTINILTTYNINVETLIMDAGYYSPDNIFHLISTKIPFIIKISKHMPQYKELIRAQGADLKSGKNTIIHDNRLLFGKKVPYELFNKQLYAFIIQDSRKELEEFEKILSYFSDTMDNKNIIEENFAAAGIFILVSSNDYNIKDILSLYHTNKTTEQVFDVSKKFFDTFPLKDISEKIIKGRILISFITAIVYSTINHGLGDSKISIKRALYTMKNLNIKIYKSITLLEHLTEQQKEIFQCLNLDCPFPEEKSNFNINFVEKDNPTRPKGDKNKQKTFTNSSDAPLSARKRARGRPKGSKNKKPFSAL
ncbi:MAG: transposase [Deltaproteobacteria bacterium]|jgi:hypothetical protein|nr:transposase [Deltaproteobacteria bacterium]